jgi:hypothetical protein
VDCIVIEDSYQEPHDALATKEMYDRLAADMMGSQPTLPAELPVLSQPTLQAQLPVRQGDQVTSQPGDDLDIKLPPYIVAKEFYKHIRGEDIIKNLNTASDPALARDI